MRFLWAAASLAYGFMAVCAAPAATVAPKLLICSDSTAANYADGNALQGWGYYINQYLSLPIVNLARNGRSTRSFINEGLWTSLLSQTASGDFVVIEMGHNDDAGDPATDPNDRTTLPGIGDNSVTITNSKGAKETVYTFGFYLRRMIADVRAKGATPVLSGMVNRNYWTGSTLQSNWPFATYAQQVAAAQGVEYVDHTKYSVKLFQSFGATKAKTYFPNDNTHTNWPGADLNAQTFVRAVQCRSGGSVLKGKVNSKGQALTNPTC